jgi:hypothetical protein
MPYEFQLVLQLPEDCPIEDMEFEDEIANALGNRGDDKSKPHFVDGNSLGAGMEFFVHTDDPFAAFELCKPLLSAAKLLDMVVAAYRSFSDDEFKVIWPIGYSGTFSP